MSKIMNDYFFHLQYHIGLHTHHFFWLSSKSSNSVTRPGVVRLFRSSLSWSGVRNFMKHCSQGFTGVGGVTGVIITLFKVLMFQDMILFL
jgi:hypothetical protein